MVLSLDHHYERSKALPCGIAALVFYHLKVSNRYYRKYIQVVCIFVTTYMDQWTLRGRYNQNPRCHIWHHQVSYLVAAIYKPDNLVILIRAAMDGL